jgi:hypothetical protein
MTKHTPEIMSFVWSKSEYERVAAQARLIAAAPDLLNALRMVLDDSGAVDWLGVRTYEVACAAIAKATGEQA